jgi:hypothetical protein
MRNRPSLVDRKALWFCAIFSIVHGAVALGIFYVSLGLAVQRHVTGAPPSLVAGVIHALASALWWPVIAMFAALPELGRILPGPLSLALLPLNSLAWAVGAWGLVQLLQRGYRKVTAHAP